ncbi:hypothetical protein HanRHA438_Chr16g0737941 [Helianthus annuus]|nr:hypothetical protein HanRHA438_Chr16g0737941 [Helianthus annuus]
MKSVDPCRATAFSDGSGMNGIGQSREMLAGAEKRECSDVETGPRLPCRRRLYYCIRIYGLFSVLLRCVRIFQRGRWLWSLSRSVAASVWYHPVYRTVLLIEIFRVPIRRLPVAMVAGCGW